jgi:hypothetical protein
MLNEYLLSFNQICFAFLLAIFVYVFCEILISEGNILDFYYRALNRLKWAYIAKPLGLCCYCFAGQLSLWLFIILNWGELNIFNTIFFITLTLFILKTIYQIYERA